MKGGNPQPGYSILKREISVEQLSLCGSFSRQISAIDFIVYDLGVTARKL